MPVQRGESGEGQARDRTLLSPSLNVTKLTERVNPTQAGLEYDLASADSCPESHRILKKKREGGVCGGKYIYIHVRTSRE